MSYYPFPEPRPIRQYVGSAGPEPSGLRLPYWVLDSHAECVSAGKADEVIVAGEDEAPDGTRYLRFAMTGAFARSRDLRVVEGRWRYVCPDCGLMDGRHTKGCGNG